MRHIVYNSNSELASFVFDGYSDDDTRLIAYREMPQSWMGRIGRGIESSLRGARLGLYPDAVTRRRLAAIARTDVVLFFAMENLHNVASIAKYVRCRDLHVFLWNPVARIKQSLAHSRRQVAKLKQIAGDIHTFDEDDAVAYGLHIAPQPYRRVAGMAGLADVDAGMRPAFYFSGVDKGRLGLLLELQAAIEQLGLDHHFHVVADHGKAYPPQAMPHLQRHWIPYACNLRASQRADCLVEIIQDHQSGPTLRSMEALFLQKKIITNRASARADAFFDPDRVLVIERVDAAEIGAFMHRPFKPVDPALLAPHEIHAWVRQVAPLRRGVAG